MWLPESVKKCFKFMLTYIWYIIRSPTHNATSGYLSIIDFFFLLISSSHVEPSVSKLSRMFASVANKLNALQSPAMRGSAGRSGQERLPRIRVLLLNPSHDKPGTEMPTKLMKCFFWVHLRYAVVPLLVILLFAFFYFLLLLLSTSLYLPLFSHEPTIGILVSLRPQTALASISDQEIQLESGLHDLNMEASLART